MVDARLPVRFGGLSNHLYLKSLSGGWRGLPADAGRPLDQPVRRVQSAARAGVVDGHAGDAGRGVAHAARHVGRRDRARRADLRRAHARHGRSPGGAGRASKKPAPRRRMDAFRQPHLVKWERQFVSSLETPPLPLCRSDPHLQSQRRFCYTIRPCGTGSQDNDSGNPACFRARMVSSLFV